MSQLNGAICYLSGPMEFAKDHGVGWRREIIDLFKADGLNIISIDPTNKPKGLDGCQVQEEMSRTKDLKQEEKWDELTEYVKRYRRYDLRFVDLSDFVITVIDPNVHMCGTYNEVIEAERQKKPRFAIIDGGLKNMPSWCFALFKWQNVFQSLEECVTHLKKLDSGELELTDNWVLIRDQLGHQ